MNTKKGCSYDLRLRSNSATWLPVSVVVVCAVSYITVFISAMIISKG